MSKILHSDARSLGVPMLFSALPQAMQDTLRKRARPKRFTDGQMIQHRGDQADGFWLIESGSVAVGQYLQSGDFRAVALLGPGDSYGELALFAGRPRVVDAIARGATEVRLIHGPDMEQALANDPVAMRRLLGGLSAQLQETLDVIADIRRGTATARIAGMLSNLSGTATGTATGAATGPVSIALTQQELGELLGLTRATVNVALRDLEQQGLVARGYGKLTVIEPEALRIAALE